MRATHRFLATLACFPLCAAAWASPAASRAAVTDADRREFVAACTLAFDQSSGNGASGVGREICECTAKESRHERVSRAALRAETSRIKADPKHPIQDQKLLNSFHYCAIETLHDR